ncbi:MAG: helix-turn-helix transcriptional regulator [Rhodococcus sp.]|nr:helix-turn-helix transcriptional regulator [Rhodococcus sp. (in: high G+C Gram-positive bacteria)]
MATDRAGFGQFVYKRRRLLNLTQDEVSAAGGPSDAAQTRAENGTGPAPSIETLRKLDKALRWVPGSAARALEGGVPTPLEDEATGTEASGGEPRRRRAQQRPLALGPSQIPLDLETIIEILGPHARLNRLAESRTDVPELADLAADLNRVVSKITGAYVTRLLEVNGGPTGPRQPLVEFAFGELLEVPPEFADPREHEEALYRRFLSGRDRDLDAATRERFRLRWEEAVANAADCDPHADTDLDAEVSA